jgi:hypothetical protein
MRIWTQLGSSIDTSLKQLDALQLDWHGPFFASRSGPGVLIGKPPPSFLRAAPECRHVL